MKKLQIKLRGSSSSGVFHDSRTDAKIIRDVLNSVIDKVNELVEETYKLREELSHKKNL